MTSALPTNRVTSAPAVTGAVDTPVAELTAVTHRYGLQVALDDLSLSLQPGEVVALLGPNGAGKTTAIRALLGLIAPAIGTARVFGCSPRLTSTRTRIGAMLQVAEIPDTLKVREHLNLFRSYYPAPLPLAELIAIAGLSGIEDRLTSQLSGGQKQRVLFALALCGNPDLIFLDEPTVGMDIETRHALWNQIRSLTASGKTVLLTTHYLEEADSLADRVVVINRGKVIAEGTPAQIKSSSGGRKIRCVTALEDQFLLSLPTVSAVTHDGEATTLTAINVEDVIREMLLRDHGLHSLEISNPALEDAFLALTRAS